MNLIVTSTIIGRAGFYIDDGWAGSGDEWSARLLSSSGEGYDVATATVTSSVISGHTGSFAGTVYVDIPLPQLPNNVQNITLDSITLDGTCLSQEYFGIEATKTATGQIKCGDVDKGASFELPRETGQIVTITDIGTWTMEEILSNVLRVYFNCTMQAKAYTTRHSVEIQRGTITATWSCTYPAPLIGKPVIIGG